MVFSQPIQLSLGIDGTQLEWTVTETGGQKNNISEAIPDSSTDLEVQFAAVQAKIQSFVMWATGGEILVETNDGTTPDDEFTLTPGGMPVFWFRSAMLSTQNPVTASITSVFVTNASGSAAVLNIKCIVDPT